MRRNLNTQAAANRGLALSILLFALLLLGVYADPVLMRRNFAGRDPLAYHLPVENAIHEAYRRGRLPVWIPEISGGRPLLANPNAGALYPVRPLLSALPFPLTARLFPFLHWLAGGLGMMMLLRSIGRSRSAAWIGAVTFVFSGVSVSEVFYSNIHPGMALLPWVAWATHRLDQLSPRPILRLSFVFGLLLLAGDVFTIGLGLLAALLWVAAERDQGSGQVRTLLGVIVAFSLGLLLALPQWIAAALWIPETNRAVLGMQLSEVVLFSIPPARLLEFLIPFPFGETWRVESYAIWGAPIFHPKAVGLFTTLYSGAFALIAVFLTWKGKASGTRFARAILVLALTLSVVPSFVPPAWRSISSPLPLRYPEKLAVAAVLGLALLAGLAFDTERDSRRRLRWALTVGGALAVLALLAALLPQPVGRLAIGAVRGEPRLAGVAEDLLPPALAEAGLLWMATCVAVDRLRRQKAVWLPLLLLTAVPIVANRKVARTFREEEVFAPPAFARYMHRRDPTGAYRVVGEEAYRAPSKLEEEFVRADPARLEFTRRDFTEYAHALWDVGTIFNHDFDAGDLSRLGSLRRISQVAAGFMDASDFFGGLSLRWGVRYRDQIPLPGYHPIGGDYLRYWDEHERPFPDIRLVERWREEPAALAALDAVPRLAAGEIVIESDRRLRGVARPGRVAVLEKRPERLLIEVEASDPTWLFVLRSFWNHRRVTIDGREVTYLPAQLAFSALPVPPGRHTIDWRELVPGWKVSRWGPVFYVAVAAILVAMGRRSERSR